MFGQNQILRAEHQLDGQTLWVQEVFGTIQGEGPFAGQAAVFVRLAGCNLKCMVCDTDFESSNWHPTLDELQAKINEVSQRDVPGATLIVLTGGEPMRQQIVPFCKRELAAGWRIQVETAGTLWISELAHVISHSLGHLTFVCSPKTGALNKEIEKRVHHFKYLIREREIDEKDGLPNMSTQIEGTPLRLYRAPLGSVVYVQPVDEQDSEKTARNIAACVRLVKQFGYRLSLQQHKIIGVP